MDRLLADLTYAFRRLARAPGFTTVALLTLALGIGANTAIFGIIRSVLLRPLPFGDPDRIVMLWVGHDKGETTWLSANEIRSYGKEAPSFEQLAAYTDNAANLTGGTEPERVVTAEVTPNLFQTLGVGLALGRGFLADDARTDDPTVVVITHELWQRRFGSDPSIIGREISMNGRNRTVVGVLPASFRLPLEFVEDRPADVWLPANLASPNYEGWGNRSFIAVGKLRAGATLARAANELAHVEDGWIAAGYVSGKGWNRRRVVAAQDFVVGDLRPALLVLVGAVGVILLIACANVANLLLARSDDRRREVALRTALGASRRNLVRQLLTESVLLAFLGGMLGAALAWSGTRLLVALHPPGVPRLDEAGIDLPALAFTLGLALLTGVVFGLAPALSLARPDISRTLKEGSRTGTIGKGQQRFRDALAIVQMAFSVVLLIGAMLLVRSFSQLEHIDLGFDTRDALTFRVTLPRTSYPESPNVIAFVRSLQDRLGQLPSVRSVGATRLLPLTGTIGDWSISIEGRPTVAGENPNGDWQVVTPGYMETMGVRLVRGRFIARTDDENAPPVAVINEAMAKKYWPGADAIGHRFHIGSNDQPWVTIVGISHAVHHNAVTESPRTEMYVPHAQWAAAGASTPRGMTFVVRTAGSPVAAVTHVREAVHALDPQLPLADVRTLENVAGDALARPRFTTVLLGLFAALALVLATVGIYGVISLLVTRRRQEIGIRMALGARAGSILQMVVGRGMALAVVALGLGIAGAMLVTRLLTTLLYGVTRLDLLSFSVAPALVAGVALAACLIPAARAAAVDPAVALRAD